VRAAFAKYKTTGSELKRGRQLNETLNYELVHDPVIEVETLEFTNQIPEYINPAWDDDALYDLICANQDVLVDVSGVIMTLSDAMNQHPGPWTPENEANLVAYAEDLLMKTLLEPREPEEQMPDEAVVEPALDVTQQEDLSVLNVMKQDQSDSKIEEPIVPKETAPSPPPKMPSVTRSEPTIPIHTEPVVKSDNKIIDKPVEYVNTLETLNRSAEPDSRTETTEQILKTIPSIEVEQVRTHEEILPPESVFEMTEINGASELAEDPYVEIERFVESIVLEKDMNRPVDEVVTDELIEPPFFEDGHEPEDDVSELILDAVRHDPLFEDVADVIINDEESSPAPLQFEQVDVVAEEVESVFAQLAELVDANTSEDNERIATILGKILDTPVELGIKNIEEWERVYTELFVAANITCTSELVESLAVLTIKWNLADELERLETVSYDTSESENGAARAMVKKLLVAITNVLQTVRHVFAIGNYALRLSVALRAGYQ